jgi:hypothetical protein
VRASTLLAPLFALSLVACTIIGGDDPQTADNPVNPNAPGAKQTKAATDVSGCGGTDAPACAIGKKCLVGKDCESMNCQDGTCAPPGVGPDAPPPTHMDGIKNLDETDVDCGGPSADVPRCGDTKTCGDGGDCTSGVCTEGTCRAPTGVDGVKNGDESDVDCGGTNTGAAKCSVGKACKVHADCDANACAYNGKCVSAKSCTTHLGGDTCGVGEVGDPNAKHTSCCETAQLPGSNVKIEKYLVTAGRMRAMIDRLNGDVRSYVKTLPGNRWNQGWNGLVPSNKAEADDILGSYFADAPNDPGGGGSKRSCHADDHTGRTYWTTPTATDYSDFSKDQLDVKALNCVGWHLMTAFCAWDGGRMATREELARAYTNNYSTQYPWQWKDNTPYSALPIHQDARLNHYYSYNYPDVPNQRFNNGALDAAYHVAPPGRFPQGWNAQGVEIAGNLLTWVNDQEYYFTWNFSWEEHPDNGNASQSWLVTAPEAPNGYYALGGRCVHD